MSLSAESQEQVDEIVAKAIAGGGKPWKPSMEEGPVYGPSLQDLDGTSGISRCGNLSRVTRPLEGSAHDFIPPPCRGAWPLGGKAFEEKF